MAYRLGNRILKIDNKLFYAEGAAPVNPVWSGLTSYWRLNETGGTTAYDSKGSYNGAITNATFDASGKRGYCLLFDSATDIMQLASTGYCNFEYNQSFSISMWIKRNAISFTASPLFYKKGSGGGYFQGYMAYINSSNQIYYTLCSDPYTYAIENYTTDTFTSMTNWYHLVMTYNGSGLASGLNMYSNGVICGKTTVSDTLGTHSIQNALYLKFGNFNNVWNTQLRMDEVGIWNRALSQTEITALYNAGNGIFY